MILATDDAGPDVGSEPFGEDGRYDDQQGDSKQSRLKDQLEVHFEASYREEDRSKDPDRDGFGLLVNVGGESAKLPEHDANYESAENRFEMDCHRNRTPCEHHYDEKTQEPLAYVTSSRTKSSSLLMSHVPAVRLRMINASTVPAERRTDPVVTTCPPARLDDD